jgi:hypothetical protein
MVSTPVFSSTMNFATVPLSLGSGQTMTLWAEKLTTNAEWIRVQHTFERHFVGLGEPRDMMLIWEKGPVFAQVRAIIALPDGSTLGLYPGFAAIKPDELPRVASLGGGYQDRFEELFDYPKR